MGLCWRHVPSPNPGSRMTSAIPFPLAEILREAIALNQALSNNNLADAQHRTRLIVTLSEIYDLQNVLSAAQELLARLGRAGLRPGPPRRAHRATGQAA